MKMIIFLAVLLTGYVFPQRPDPYIIFPSAVGNVWEYSTPNGETIYKIKSSSVDSSGSRFIYFNEMSFNKLHFIGNTISVITPHSRQWYLDCGWKC